MSISAAHSMQNYTQRVQSIFRGARAAAAEHEKLIAGAVAMWILWAASSAGDFNRAAPDIAVLFAAGSIWIVGYVCARKRGLLDILWAGVVWSSFAYCAWMFFDQMGRILTNDEAGAITARFASPASASVTFGLLTIIAAARIVHVIKQVHAEALARSAMIDRLMRDGLGGLLLLVFAASCLGLSGSRTGVMFTAGVMLAHVWWDTRGITHSNALIRSAGLLAPLTAIAFSSLGITLAWLQDAPGASGGDMSDALPQVQRIAAYATAWLENPIFG
jgi:hypothetical protein